MNLFKYVGIVILGAVIYFGTLYFKTTKQVVEYTMLVAPMLSDVSESWNTNSVQNHIDPIEFNQNVSFYESMLSNLSYLGEFESCHHLKVVDTGSAPSLDQKIMRGHCSFTNGSANLIAIFSYDKGVAKLFHFVLSEKGT